ncbi:MAG TPA: hypothetical protein VH021_07995 [Trebonia sp.]|nr:hypothetical protein [Trebonia sp.]
MSGRTKTDDVAFPAGTASGRHPLPTRLAGVAEWLRSTLFLPPVARAVGWRQVAGGTVFVVIGAAVSLARTAGPGALNTIWIEDANNFLQDALHESVMTTLTTQMNGYYDVVPRAVTAIAMTFPLTWVAGVMSACAAVGYSVIACIAYIASGPHLRSPWLRLLVAAPACLIPLGYTQANNDLATTQFIALYGIFWLLLWRPGTWAGQLAAPVIMLGTTLSSILPLLFAPLVAARLIADRSKVSIAIAVCWAAGLVAQWSVQLRGMSDRRVSGWTNPLWVLGNYVTRVVPRALFGERALGGPGTNGDGHPLPLVIPNMAVHTALTWGAWAIVVAAIIIAVVRLTAPDWPLAVTALLFSVLLFLGEIVNNLPVVQPRYVIAPALLVYAGIVAMLRPRGAAGAVRSRSAAIAWSPVVVFALVLAVTIGFNYRVTNGRSQSPPWTAVVAAATRTCMRPGEADYFYHHHGWWQFKIPCGRVSSSS